jgi:cytochrome c-type biogenesis protein CcmH/NrfG
LALVHVLQRHVPEAIATFEQITKVDSQNPYAWSFLAFVNLYNFQPQAAQQALAKVEAINPKLPELRTLKIATAIMQFQFTSALQM